MKMLTSLLFTIAIGLSTTAYSGEVSAPNLKLKTTYLKTTDVGLTISTSPTDAFSPTTVTCPRPGPCVLSIQLATQFNGLNPPNPNVVAAIVTVDGSTAAVLPNGVLGLSSTSTGGGSDARSFIWVAEGLYPGPHSVQIQFFVPNGSASSANRTLKIDVYESNRTDHSE